MLRPPTPFVRKVDPPRREGCVRLGRRRLGYAEFGDPDGHLVIWSHGTPGARRQIPPVGRRAADGLGIRLVCVERPGVGSSTGHRYARIADFAPDAAAVADDLGHERFAVVGLSGGGPYALAAAALVPDRVVGAGILGGVCPIVGVDACDARSVVHLSGTFKRLLETFRVPMGIGMWAVLQPLVPFAHFAYSAYARVAPAGDRTVLSHPDLEAMFVDDLVHGSGLRFGAIAHDIALFGRHWGFTLDQVQVPVRWWHGDADNLVPLDHAVATAERLADCELHVRHDESHLGGFAAADEVLAAVLPFFDGAKAGASR